jgi:hypothetical protein
MSSVRDQLTACGDILMVRPHTVFSHFNLQSTSPKQPQINLPQG